jgi:hypothetical protein
MPAQSSPGPRGSAVSPDRRDPPDWRDQRIANLEARVAHLEQQLARFQEEASHLEELAIPENQLPTLAPDADIAVRWGRSGRVTVEPKAVVD